MEKPLSYINFSHNDLDGIWSAIAIRAAHSYGGKRAHVKTVFVDYTNVDSELYKALTADRYSRIILSDISFTPRQDRYSSEDIKLHAEFKNPKAIMYFVNNGGELVVLDHHQRALSIKNQYAEYLHEKSILEIVDEYGVPRAGSELAARYYGNEGVKAGRLDKVIQKYCEIAGEYDTWRNPHGYGGLLAMASQVMNDPYRCMNDFEKSISLICKDSFRDIEEYDDKRYIQKLHGTTIGLYVSYVKDDYEKSLERSLSGLKTLCKNPINISQIYAPNYGSVISDHIYNKTGGIVIIRYDKNSEKISLRCSKNNHLIDLGEFAKLYGGGGHASASGLNLGGDSISSMVDKLLSFMNK